MKIYSVSSYNNVNRGQNQIKQHKNQEQTPLETPLTAVSFNGKKKGVMITVPLLTAAAAGFIGSVVAGTIGAAVAGALGGGFGAKFTQDYMDFQKNQPDKK